MKLFGACLVGSFLFLRSLPAESCSTTFTVEPGPVGARPWYGEDDEPLIVPLNAAFVDVDTSQHSPDPAPVAQRVGTSEYVYATETLIPAGRLVWQTVSRPAVLLEPGAEYENQLGTFPSTFFTSDVVDTEAPLPPEVSEPRASRYSGDSCGEGVGLSFSLLPGSDDHTAREDLIYAIYLGRSEAEAREMDTPFQLESLYGKLTAEPERLPRVGLDLGSESEGRDVYLSVSTVDMSGNESPRSAPVHVVVPPPEATGCGCRHAGGHQSPTAPLMACVAVAVLVMRRRTGKLRLGS